MHWYFMFDVSILFSWAVDFTFLGLQFVSVFGVLLKKESNN